LYRVPSTPQQPAAPQQPSHDVLSITEEDIAVTFNDKILSEVTEIVNGTKRSWWHNIFSGCIYTANQAGVDKSELKYNAAFGDFDESQTYFMLTLIAEKFSTTNKEYIMKVLLPSLGNDITRQIFSSIVVGRGRWESSWRNSMKIKMERLPKKKATRKRKMPEENHAEVVFLKRSKMDKNSIRNAEAEI